MGAARKLQGEIDRTLKKVQEGIDEFDQIWQKVHDTENANQKEKFEADLKKEIKKLQRLRDQIKTWINGADIKDKTPLFDARKAIEREMERFKACEKEAKMKQFSKAALGLADKLDPREQAKSESRCWINDVVEQLNVQIEQYEYEIEELAANLKKKAKPPPKLLALEEVVTVHKKHTILLEKALRCLDNDAISSEDIDPLKEELEYYLAQSQEDGGHYDNVDDLYADLADRLDAVEAAAPAAAVVHVGKGKELKTKTSGGGAPGEKTDEEKERDKERERERAVAAAAKAQLAAQGALSVKPLDDEERKLLRPNSLSTPTTPSGAAGVPSSPALMGLSGVPPSPSLAASQQPTPRGVPPILSLAGLPSKEEPPPPPPPDRSPRGRPLGPTPSTPTPAATPPAAAAAAVPPPSPVPQEEPSPAPIPPAAERAAAAANAAPPAAAAAVSAGKDVPAQTAAAAEASPGPPPLSPGRAATAAPGTTAAVAAGGGLGPGQPQPQQQQQQQTAGPGPAGAAAAAGGGGSGAPGGLPVSNGPGPMPPAVPPGGRLGAWMAGAPDAKAAAAAAAAGRPGQPPAVAVGQKGPAAAGGAAAAPAGAAAGAAGRPGGVLAGPAAAAALAAGASNMSQQQQGQQQQQAGVVAAAAGPGPGSQQADGTVAAATGAAGAATADGAPTVAAAAAAAAAGEGAEGAAELSAAMSARLNLDAWSSSSNLERLTRLALTELGLGQSLLQVPIGQPALPVLEACFRSALPQPADSDWSRLKPRHPVATPPTFPKTAPDVISAPALFRKMDPEALFFAFYYQPDTYQQYLAAQELKRQSWRYHKHHNAWFQRYAEPNVTTEEYEQGTYVYFDYNIMHDDLQTGWCYRRKENFTFRYDALEDELPVQQ